MDLYFGLFARYNLNDTWAIDTKFNFLIPQSINGSYNHANNSKVDSGQLIKVTDSRKAYFVSIPLNLTYNAGNVISFKAGPVINIPVKQLSGVTTLLPAGIKKDSAYYSKTTTVLAGTKYQQNINFSLSLGAAVYLKRLVFEADYLQNLSGYQVKSGYGSFTSHTGSRQFSVGFQLNKPKVK